MISLQFAQIEKGASKGLCLEFILLEYSKALALSDQLDDSNPKECLKILEKLFADPLNTSIMVEPGILDKLCFYCEALVQTSKTGETLLGAMDELRNSVALPRSLLARQMRAIPTSSQNMGDLLQKIQDELRAFFDQLVPIFQDSLDCEAALFALLELRFTLNRYLGDQTVENFLQQLFPAGPEDLRQTISNGFSKRGFGDFCQRHETLFETLAWPQPVTIAPKP